MKRFLIMALSVAMTFVATSAMATIVGSKHDMTAGVYIGTGGTGVNEICVYCHTPHSATQAVPLWNRTNIAATTNYANNGADSATMDHAIADVDSTSISGKCLSCHNGAVAPGAVANSRVTGGNVISGVADLGDLQNDHPVAFVYNPALDSDGDGGGTGFDTQVNAEADGVVFFGTGSNEVECASCHAVHDTTELFFLRTTNAASGLCLACHLK